jgi:hypothetical protein
MLIKQWVPSISVAHYLLVRNPYDRIESFFKEKLRSKVREVTNLVNPYQLKLHQEIFYPFAGIMASDDLNTKQQKLLNFSWDDFILTLPHVYLKDEHLRPQSYIMRQLVKRAVPISFRFDRIFQIESADHLKIIASDLHIDLTIRENQTARSEEVVWNRNALDIVNDLYHRDFEMLGYNER